ncbi:MAG: bifunctional 5,10-methylenetetrahydrofolate dehydrogenase/5,10-methenyltetrahydrofolate cyclohydrolase [Patescibacteria group bacterium]
MLVDGHAIASEIYASLASTVASLPTPPRLTALTSAPNFETQKYLSLKKKKAEQVGVRLNIVELPSDSATPDVVLCIEKLAPQTNGIVVQLPLPAHIDKEVVLAAVPLEKDPDGFLYGTHAAACVPPVVAAIAAIADRYKVKWTGKKVVVVGHGRLVGQPAAHFAKNAGADVTVITETSKDIEAALKAADIIISGVGKPNLVTPDMVRDGVVVFDAGTSEDGGVLADDVHKDVARRAALFTPVPGGIGPITIACLLRNVVALARQ